MNKLLMKKLLWLKTNKKKKIFQKVHQKKMMIIASILKFKKKYYKVKISNKSLNIKIRNKYKKFLDFLHLKKKINKLKIIWNLMNLLIKMNKTVL